MYFIFILFITITTLLMFQIPSVRSLASVVSKDLPCQFLATLTFSEQTFELQLLCSDNLPLLPTLDSVIV